MSGKERMVKPLDKNIGWAREMRGRLFGLPFRLVQNMTRWDLDGQERLIALVQEHQRTGRGLITVSNHVSLFDDPLVYLALLGVEDPTELSKCWYSTACATNFHPSDGSMSARLTRSFSEVANMVLLSRAHKRGDSNEPMSDPLEHVKASIDERLQRNIERRMAELDVDLDTYLQSFLTPWGKDIAPARVASFNQAGLIESMIRVDCGDWVNFFPEGGRARDLHLRPARPGVGKVLWHSREARVVPVCIYGTQDIMPVGSRLPTTGKTVHVSVGDPIDPAMLEERRGHEPSLRAFQALSDLAMGSIAELRPAVLERYLGAEACSKLLLEEAQMKRAMSRGVPAGRAPGSVAIPFETPEPMVVGLDSQRSMH